MAQQDLCALHCGTGVCTRASPLWAEQRVFIVLLIWIAGLLLGHRHRNGGGQVPTPLPAGCRPAASAALERPHLILRPCIYKQTHRQRLQDRQTHTGENRVGWTHARAPPATMPCWSGWHQPSYELMQDGGMRQLCILTHGACTWPFLLGKPTSETNPSSKWISKLHTNDLEEHMLCTNHISQLTLYSYVLHTWLTVVSNHDTDCTKNLPT